MSDQPAPILTPANMHAAIDPNGVEVFCDFADKPAMTNDGFCQYCGATDHRTIVVPEREARRQLASEPDGYTRSDVIERMLGDSTAPLPEPRTRKASEALGDELSIAGIKQLPLDRGSLIVELHQVEQGLQFGLSTLAWKDPAETGDDIRAAIRAYGEWLIRVADNAQ